MKFKDSCINGCEKTFGTYDGLYDFLKVVDELKASKLDFVSIDKKSYQKDDVNIIDYGFISGKSATFYTSYYVGFYSKGTINITISPRFGDNIRDYLYSYALGLYLPKSVTGSASSEHNHWLLCMLWVGSLEYALNKSNIPKNYERIKKNQKYFKGSLDISNHINHNLVNANRFYCSYSKQTYNTPINRAILKAYNHLLRLGFSNMLNSVSSHIQMLRDFKVGDDVRLDELKSIHYTPLNKAYQKVVSLSELIIKNQGSKSSFDNSNGFGYFLDLSEVWEGYLYKLMSKNLQGFKVVNGNFASKNYLFNDNKRELRPDFFIYKDSKLVAVLDAKYKNYSCFGQISCVDGAISREDLYQMSAYMYRFNAPLGIFLSPNTDDVAMEQVTGKDSKMAILGINLDSIKEDESSILELKSKEQSFISNLLHLLKDY
ncbi:McrC family protein [Campylobacter sp. RM12637]|uniref:McrC family protein n=1 Tax=Campylobacter sp. RM12637 TaxID=2735734 RepID=UPI00301463BA|nr:hypothetical protein [Campylobacter sp. RM12637]